MNYRVLFIRLKTWVRTVAVTILLITVCAYLSKNNLHPYFEFFLSGSVLYVLNMIFGIVANEIIIDEDKIGGERK